MYRNTPIRATGYTPAEMILRYSPGCNIPSLLDHSTTPTDQMYKEAREKDLQYKQNVKKGGDVDQKRFCESTIKAGDLVLVKYQKTTKGQPVFDPHPFTVKQRVGNRVYMKRNGKDLCRPLHFLKKVPHDIRLPNVPNPSDHRDDDLMPRNPTVDEPMSNMQQLPVSSPSHLRNTLDAGRFRSAVLRNPSNNLAPVQPPTQQPMQPSIQQVPNPRYTGSGRISRPVLGNRLIDQV